MKKIQTFASLVALIGLGIVATSCSGGGDTDEAPIKTGTDTLTMVCHGSRGDLVSRRVSRLDAFSVYPVRT